MILSIFFVVLGKGGGGGAQHIIQSGSTFYFTSRLIRIKPFCSWKRGSSARLRKGLRKVANPVLCLRLRLLVSVQQLHLVLGVDRQLPITHTVLP